MEPGSFTLPVLILTTQCAAVSTWLLVMMEPPQYGADSPGDTSPTCVHKYQLKTPQLKSCKLLPTCQGYSLASVSTPPTILVTLLTWPQLHVAEVVVAVVVVMGPVVVVVTGDGVDVDGVVVVGAEHLGK